MTKYLKSRGLPLEEGNILKRKTHARMQSQEFVKISDAKLLIENPKERARFNLLSDYGSNIENYLK